MKKSVRILAFTVCVLLANLNGWGQTTSVTLTSVSTNPWAVPNGVSQVYAECWGGGGAGGSAKGNNSPAVRATGGGGAGGAYAAGLSAVTGGSTASYSAAAAVTTSASSVVNGNPSWFGSTSNIFAEGGAGGASVTASSVKLMGAGGVGSSSSSIGTIKNKGGDGWTSTDAALVGGGGGGASAGTGASNNGTTATSTSGGVAVTGGGVGGNGASSAGNNGAAPASGVGGGGGGAWAAASTTQRNGGSGAAGQVKVTYYLVPTISLSGISPNTGTAGSNVNITVTGTNFFSGISTITVDGVAVSTGFTNSTTLTATINVAAGAHDIGVTNTGPFGTSSSISTQTFTASSASGSIIAATSNFGPFCNNGANPVSLTYTTSGTVTTPLILQLSNSSGSFASGTTNLATTQGVGSVSADIPALQAAGTYRIRIVSSDITPIASSDNGSNISIVAPVVFSSNYNVCSNGNTGCIALPAGGTGGTWSALTSPITMSSCPAGQFGFTGNGATVGAASATFTTATGGCNSVVNITVIAPPATPTITPPATVCAGSTGNVFSASGSGTFAWSVSGSGWSIPSASTTNSVTVTAGAVAGTVSATVNSGGCTSASGSSSVTPTTIPAAPIANGNVSPQVSGITTNSFNANWVASAGATSYTLNVFSGSGASDDFTDGDFTANPIWSGSTGSYQMYTANPLNTTVTTDGSFMGSASSQGNVTLVMPSTEVSEWKFSLATGGFNPSDANIVGVVLMSDAAIPGDISASSWNGYYLKLGVDGTTDPIELWEKAGGGIGTKVGDFPSSPNYATGALVAGLNIRVTRSAAGVFELFYSTGFTYASTPVTSAGTLTDNSTTTSAYFGIFQRIVNTSTTRVVYIDNIVLGNQTILAGYPLTGLTGTSQVVGSGGVGTLSPNTTYYYNVTATNACGTSTASNQVTVTTDAVPTLNAGTLNAFGTRCTLSNTDLTFNLSGSTLDGSNLSQVNISTPNGSAFLVSVDGSNFSNSVNYTYTGSGFTNIPITVRFNPSSATTFNSNITISGGGASSITVGASGTGVAAPAQPSAINGNDVPCPSSTGLGYNVTNVLGVTYTWAFPSGWTSLSGQGNSSVTVTAPASGSGSVTVTPSIGLCNGTAQTRTLTVTTLPSQPSTISGPALPCVNSTGNVYSVTPDAGVTYTWSVFTGNSWSIPTPSTTGSVTVSAGDGSSSLTVTPYRNGCAGTARTRTGLNTTDLFAPTVSIANSTPYICAGSANTFTATRTDGGAGSNAFDWKVNGTSTGVTAATYSPSANTLAAGDKITCVLTVSGSCASPTTGLSNALIAQQFMHSPVNIFSQTFGNTTGGDLNTFTGYDAMPAAVTITRNPTVPVTCTTYPDIRSSGSIFSPASGASHIFFPTQGTGGGCEKYAQINGLNTSAAFPNVLSFYLYNPGGLSLDNSRFKVEYSDNGGALVPLYYTPISSTQGWYLVTIVNGLPASSNLALRFTNTTGLQPRLDDIKIDKYTSATASITPSVTPPTFCGTGTVQLASAPTATPALTYAWSSNPSSPNFLDNTNTSNPTATNVTATRTYTVTITDAFTCSSSASQAVTINPVPNVYTVNPSTMAAGTYCSGSAGVNVGINSSQTTVNYQLFFNGNPQGSPVAGTGNPSQSLFGPQTAAGNYTVVATHSTGGCTANMTGTAVISVNPLPTVYNVTGGGSYCIGGSGVAVGLSNSQNGISYQLLLNGNAIGSPVSGTGAAISFGNQTLAGTYTVSATSTLNTVDCSSAMNGSAIVAINPVASVQLGTSTALFTEGFGTGLPSGWSINTPSGSQYDWTVASSSPSSGYAGASGGNHFIIANGIGGANATTLSQLKSGSIDISSYSNISVRWAARKTASYPSSPAFYYSTDGNSWTEVPYIDVAANAWAFVNGGAPVSIPNLNGATTLYLRWDGRAVADFSNYRIDDVVVYGLADITACSSAASVTIPYNSSANSTGYTLSAGTPALGGFVTQTGTLNSGAGTISLAIPANSSAGTYNFTLSLSGSNGCNSTYSIPVTLNTCTNTWTGATSTAWGLNANWSSGVVPTAVDNATIPDVTNDPVISSAVTIKDISLAAGATITVAGNASLTLNGTFTNNGATTIQHNGHFLQGPASSYGGSGTFTVEKTVANAALGYRDIASPVNGTVANLADDISLQGQDGVNCWYSYSPYPNVQVYDESANHNLSTPAGNYYTGWISKTGTGNAMLPLQGFAVRKTSTSGPFNAIDFTGTPYNGPQSRAITLTPSATTSQDGWNFVGNAYPSNIDWVTAAALNPDITGAYYVFNTTGEYTGNWGTCNASGICSGLGGISRYIASGQGFFVKANQPGSFVLNNSVRTTTAANYYKSATQANEIRLQLTGQGNMDEIVAYTDAVASWNEDNGLDAVKIAAGSTVYMSYKQLGKEYAINVIDEITETTELPLVLWAQDTGTYTFEATELNVDGYITYLKDAELNTLTDLNTNNSVTLQLNGQQVYEGRYSIVFEAVEIPSGIVNINEGTIKIYSHNNIAVVERPTDAKATITISNMLGQTIKEVTSESKRTEIQLDNTNPWYAVVKVKDANATRSQKVMIK